MLVSIDNRHIFFYFHTAIIDCLYIIRSRKFNFKVRALSCGMDNEIENIKSGGKDVNTV